MTDYQKILATQKNRLLKALYYLNYSYKKICVLPEEVSRLDAESLETWESFAARFARVSELFLAKYLRSFVLLNDPGFSGSMRDFVNQGEKLGVVADANRWMVIRELRNITAHEYTDEELSYFFMRLKEECPLLLALQDSLSV